METIGPPQVFTDAKDPVKLVEMVKAHVTGIMGFGEAGEPVERGPGQGGHGKAQRFQVCTCVEPWRLFLFQV